MVTFIIFLSFSDRGIAIDNHGTSNDDKGYLAMRDASSSETWKSGPKFQLGRLPMK
jgi:hypothetical protein